MEERRRRPPQQNFQKEPGQKEIWVGRGRDREGDFRGARSAMETQQNGCLFNREQNSGRQNTEAAPPPTPPKGGSDDGASVPRAKPAVAAPSPVRRDPLRHSCLRGDSVANGDSTADSDSPPPQLSSESPGSELNSLLPGLSVGLILPWAPPVTPGLLGR